ncbi:succinate dehydrogenase assembly factor 2 [Tranquillimonas alkanivorans]|uniref:FAD assembly factor SdhE n=1 Tax=Tranquillimonas alkanivorans TaxID=441119 RepID=A0A1I5KFU2_9RHOB|nr:succinate dehydrogenase assembly factor 2 [Tranquillimonas alkanivorans]SFO83858.1 antitoxin CptB [Tranquillimonas alkanivorans]
MSETTETRLKRLHMRSWRRGIKEMDLILGGWSDEKLKTLPAERLDLYEDMLNENDQDLYRWVSGQEAPPDRFAPLIEEIAAHARVLGRGAAG